MSSSTQTDYLYWGVTELRIGLIAAGQEDEPIYLEPNHPYFKLMAMVAALGFDLLQSTKGRSALKKVGKEILQYSQTVVHPRFRREAKHMDTYIHEFLYKVSESWPNLYIRDIHSINGQTHRYAWNTPPDRHYWAKGCAVVELNERLIRQLHTTYTRYRQGPNYAQEKERFQTLLARLSITMAHEMVHMFTCYLLIDPRQATPEEVHYTSYPTQDVGEAGRRWEYFAFGGRIDMRGGVSPGDYAIAICNNLNQNVRVLSHDAILDVLEARIGSENLDIEERQGPVREEGFIWRSRADIFAGAPQTRPRSLRPYMATLIQPPTATCYRIPAHVLRGLVWRPENALSDVKRQRILSVIAG